METGTRTGLLGDLQLYPCVAISPTSTCDLSSSPLVHMYPVNVGEIVGCSSMAYYNLSSESLFVKIYSRDTDAIVSNSKEREFYTADIF